MQGHSLDGRLETFYRPYKSPIFLWACGFRPGGTYLISICPNQILQKSNVFWKNELCPFFIYLNNFPPGLWFGNLSQGHFTFFQFSGIPSYAGSMEILNEIKVFNLD